MIPTSPSDDFGDFMAFFQLIAPDARLDLRVGAKEKSIDEFRSLCGFPLPDFYIDYLRAFGASDGGLELFDDADGRVDRLTQYYRGWAQMGVAPGPKDSAVIAMAGLTGGRALHYREPFADEPPIVVSTGGWCIEDELATSFCNYLYAQAFDIARFPAGVPCSAILTNGNAASLDAVVDHALRVGFTSYWFSDRFKACLEGYEHSLIVFQECESVTLFLNGSEKALAIEFKQEFISRFGFKDASAPTSR